MVFICCHSEIQRWNCPWNRWQTPRLQVSFLFRWRSLQLKQFPKQGFCPSETSDCIRFFTEPEQPTKRRNSSDRRAEWSHSQHSGQEEQLVRSHLHVLCNPVSQNSGSCNDLWCSSSQTKQTVNYTTTLQHKTMMNGWNYIVLGLDTSTRYLYWNFVLFFSLDR